MTSGYILLFGCDIDGGQACHDDRRVFSSIRESSDRVVIDPLYGLDIGHSLVNQTLDHEVEIVDYSALLGYSYDSIVVVWIIENDGILLAHIAQKITYFLVHGDPQNIGSSAISICSA